MNRFLRRKYGEIESQECFNSKQICFNMNQQIYETFVNNNNKFGN